MPFEPEPDELEVDEPVEQEAAEGTGETVEPEGEPSGEGPSAAVESDAAFYDASKVPEALRPTFREMQASFTKKTQEIADLRRSIEHVQNKAGLFDRLMGDQRVVSYLQKLASGETDGSEVGNQVEVDDETRQILSSATSPLEQRLRQIETNMRLERERSSFINEHPTWEKEVGGAQGMARAWQARPENENMTYEQAYRWVMHEKLLAKIADMEKRAGAGRAQVEGRGSPRGVVGGPKINSVSDAVNAALAELNLDKRDYGL